MGRKVEIHNENDLPTVSYKKIKDFQEDLKLDLLPYELDKLKRSILKHGIFNPKFVWKNGDDYFMLDGHQTKKALASLEDDGYEVPEIPIVLINAKDRRDALEKLLILNSSYGKINKKSGLLDKYDLQFDLFEIREFELSKIEIDYEKEVDEFELSNKCPKCGYEW